MHDTKTLSATQIRFLRISPRVNQSKLLKKKLIQALQQQTKDQGAQFAMGIGNLNKIPKFGYSQLAKTVNNFGVLINQNYGNSSSLHQIQKFGKLAKQVDKLMQLDKDKPLQDDKKSYNSRVTEKQDKRTFIKSIYSYQGQKIFVILHSFSIEAVGQNYKEIIPFSYLKLLISKVGSSKLSRVIEGALRFETENVQINYGKIQQKTVGISNSEQKYQSLGYKFEKIGTQFKINLPYLQFSHVETDFKQIVFPSNVDTLSIINDQFENVHDIVYKYFDHQGFSKVLGPSSDKSNVVAVQQQNQNEQIYDNEEQQDRQEQDQQQQQVQIEQGEQNGQNSNQQGQKQEYNIQKEEDGGPNNYITQKQSQLQNNQNN